MEREIRKTKQYALFLGKSGDAKGAKLQEFKVKAMVDKYKAYCNENGYAWEKYRIDIR